MVEKVQLFFVGLVFFLSVFILTLFVWWYFGLF